MTEVVPPKLADIVEAFKESQGREKIELLFEFSQSLAPLPERLKSERDKMETVPECVTPIFLHAENSAEGLQWFFDIPEEAPTVRGYAGVLTEGLTGTTPEEVLAVPADFWVPMGLAGVISGQRINGMNAILAHMKRVAVQSAAPV